MPYAWAPNQLLANEGMRRYGFNEEADRAAYEFLSTVAENFRHDGTIREKYNAVTRSSETAVTAGYHINIVGFRLDQRRISKSVARLAQAYGGASRQRTRLRRFRKVRCSSR